MATLESKAMGVEARDHQTPLVESSFPASSIQPIKRTGSSFFFFLFTFSFATLPFYCAPPFPLIVSTIEFLGDLSIIHDSSYKMTSGEVNRSSIHAQTISVHKKSCICKIRIKSMYHEFVDLTRIK